jgi:hypothetical protein
MKIKKWSHVTNSHDDYYSLYNSDDFYRSRKMEHFRFGLYLLLVWPSELRLLSFHWNRKGLFWKFQHDHGMCFVLRKRHALFFGKLVKPTSVRCFLGNANGPLHKTKAYHDILFMSRTSFSMIFWSISEVEYGRWHWTQQTMKKIVFACNETW